MSRFGGREGPVPDDCFQQARIGRAVSVRPDSPLPLRTRGVSLGLTVPAESYAHYRQRAWIYHPHGYVLVELRTDSRLLFQFFSENWATAPDEVEVDATITALRGDAAYYGLDPGLDGARWYFRDRQHVFFLANEAYANLKITVRGLCSQIRTPSVIWVHGCALALNLGGIDQGVMLLGRSGGGKTTITATLRRMLGADRVRVVNDDWGPVSLRTGAAVYTGETALHMKYMSVRAHNKFLDPSPQTFPSEHFTSDPTDPVPRLLIQREVVFGSDGIADSCEIGALVLLLRAGNTRRGVHQLGGDALEIIEKGEYSAYYDAIEPFFNGSLFLSEQVDTARHRQQYALLMSISDLIAVGNVETPELVAERLLSHLGSRSVGRCQPAPRSTGRGGSP